MAAATAKSTTITNFEASPRTLAASSVQGGQEQVISGIFTVATTNIDDAGDIMLLCPIPSNAVIHDIILRNSAIAASALAVDVGLFYSADGTAILSTAYTAASA